MCAMAVYTTEEALDVILGDDFDSWLFSPWEAKQQKKAA